MADKITQETYVDINLGFVDEDTRKIKVPNALPSNQITTAQIRELDEALKPTISGSEVSFLVGDRTGAEFAGILTVDRVVSKKTDFDIAN